MRNVRQGPLRGARQAAPLFFALAVCGCRPPSVPAPAAPGPASDVLAPGVVHRAIPTGGGQGIDLIDVDLTRASIKIGVAAQGIKRVQGAVTGLAYTPHEWLDKTGALAVVNGGYFGEEVVAGRKEIMGLLVQGGRVRHAATVRRAAFGIGSDGAPSIVWAQTAAGHPQSLTAHNSLSGPEKLVPSWRVQSAVGCGPMLILEGRVVTTDRQERLVSPGPEPRTFVAYDGKGSHFVLGMASGMEYRDLAEWLHDYFPRYNHTQAAAAMCLDGGASTQLSYRQGGTVRSPRETGVTVPDAVVILPH